MTTEQNIHLSRIYFRGTITQSTGSEDNTKLVKTKEDGRFDSTVLDIYPILKEAQYKCKDIILPSTIYGSNDGTNNNISIMNYFDSTSRLSYLYAHSNENSQDIDLISEYSIPFLFSEWEDNAILFSCMVSNKDNISLEANLYTPSELSSIIYNVPYSSMTKTDETTYDTVSFIITRPQLYSLIPTIKFGDNNSGISVIIMDLKVTMNADDWIKIYLGSISYNYKRTMLELDYDDGWE